MWSYPTGTHGPRRLASAEELATGVALPGATVRDERWTILSAIAATFTTGHEVQACRGVGWWAPGQFDFFELFHFDAPRTAATTKVRVIQVSTQFIMPASDGGP